MSTSNKRHRKAEEIEALVQGFETCAIPASEFDHGAHLTVALSYLHVSRLTVEEASERLREGLCRFLDHHAQDRQKYNETITLFWLKLVRSFLDHKRDPSRTPADLASELLEAYGNAQLVFSFYSRARLLSEGARKKWVDPDLQPLEF